MCLFWRWDNLWPKINFPNVWSWLHLQTYHFLFEIECILIIKTQDLQKSQFMFERTPIQSKKKVNIGRFSGHKTLKSRRARKQQTEVHFDVLNILPIFEYSSPKFLPQKVP